jgi:hypothetical protein
MYILDAKCDFAINDRGNITNPEFELPITVNPLNNEKVDFDVEIPSAISTLTDYNEDSHTIRTKSSVHNSGLPDGSYVIKVRGTCATDIYEEIYIRLTSGSLENNDLGEK